MHFEQMKIPLLETMNLYSLIKYKLCGYQPFGFRKIGQTFACMFFSKIVKSATDNFFNLYNILLFRAKK